MRSVVHLSSGDDTEQETALAVVENMLADESDSIDEVAVVAQSEGIEAVTADGDYADQVRSLLEDGVPVKGCANTLELKDLAESDLVDGVETVPEGAVEVTRLQDEGYAYLRP